MISQNLVETFQNSIRKNWNIAALSNYGGDTITYGEAGERIFEFHLLFRRMHVKKGDKIALVGKNSINWALTYLATITYGAVIVPILPDFPANDVHHIVNHSDAVLLYSAESLYDKMDVDVMENLVAVISLDSLKPLEVRKKIVTRAYEKTREDFIEHHEGYDSPEKFVLEPVDNSETASINYTSGTSGFSKGVELPHNSLMSNILYAQRNMPLKAGHKLVSFLPLAHAYGCAFEFLFPFTMGCHIHFLQKIPSPRIIIEAFKKIRPELILSVPLVIEKIYRKQILGKLNKKSMKMAMKVGPVKKIIHKKIREVLFDVFGGNFHELVIGGAALNHEVERFFKEIKFPFTVGYGMTECGPLVCYSSWDTIKQGSVGKRVDDLEIRIDSEDPAREVGEILVRGESVMKGYYKNPEATKKAIDAEGWLHTGDLGLVDADGFVFIKGRSKDMILGPSGQNIYPEEIESKLNNFESVMESLVIEKNNGLSALVHLDYEVLGSEVKEQEIQEIIVKIKNKINQELPAYSKIKQVEIYPTEFEKTPTKKIKRFLYTIPMSNKH